MRENYWCGQSGSFPTVSKGKAGPNQTTAGTEIGSCTALQKTHCFPLHQTWLLAAYPACTGHCFEPVSCLPETAFRKLRLAASQSNTFLLLFLACILGHISHFFHSRPNIIGYASCVLLAKQIVSKQYIMPAFLQNIFRTRHRIYNPFEDLMLVLLDGWARKLIFLLPSFSVSSLGFSRVEAVPFLQWYFFSAF